MSQKVKKDDEIFLGNSLKAKEYVFSTAAYIPYDGNKMPSQKKLVEDLEEMIRYYEEYIDYKEEGTEI